MNRLANAYLLKTKRKVKMLGSDGGLVKLVTEIMGESEVESQGPDQMDFLGCDKAPCFISTDSL